MRWTPTDAAMAGYAVYIAVLLVITRSIPEWPVLVVLHVVFLIGLWLLPPRGASWERSRPEPSGRNALRKVAAFLRYMYPLLIVLLFFEEGQLIVNILYPESPYWFEPYLYAADHRLLGGHPSVLLVPYLSRPLNELMHFFYFSYFLVLTLGPLLGRLPPPGAADRHRRFHRPEFETALGCMVLGFVCAFVWYPWIPARGPFENAELMASLPLFEGGPFTFLARWITDGAAVSGNCFPSAHVAGTWGVSFGLLVYYRRLGLLMAALAVGISVSCVYTRYHHAVDVPAGFLAGLSGTALYFLFARALAVGRETKAYVQDK